MEKTAFHYTMPTTLYKKLQNKADEKNISVASLIRMICSEYLSKEV